MRKIWTLGSNSFREYMRERIVLVCFVVAIFLFIMSLLLGALSFAEQQRILAHFGFLAVHLAGLGIALFLGASTLRKEMERQTCLLVLARPVSRAQFMLGKLIGILGVITLIDILLAVFLFALLKGKIPGENYFLIFLGIWMEQALMLGVAMFFSVATRASLAIFVSISIFLIGHWVEDVYFFAKKVNSGFLYIVSKISQYIFPNLYQMNWRSTYFLENGIPDQHILWVILHVSGWLVLLVSATNLVFWRKDLV